MRNYDLQRRLGDHTIWKTLFLLNASFFQSVYTTADEPTGQERCPFLLTPAGGSSGSPGLRLAARGQPQRETRTALWGPLWRAGLSPEEKMAKATGRRTSPHVPQSHEPTHRSPEPLLTSIRGRRRGAPPAPGARRRMVGGAAPFRAAGFAPWALCPSPASGSLLNWNPANNHVSSG